MATFLQRVGILDPLAKHRKPKEARTYVSSMEQRNLKPCSAVPTQPGQIKEPTSFSTAPFMPQPRVSTHSDKAQRAMRQESWQAGVSQSKFESQGKTSVEDSSKQHALSVEGGMSSAESKALQVALEESATMARQKLEQVLELYDAKVCPVQADGNCQFRALSLQLCGSEQQHVETRRLVVAQLRARPDAYAPFVEESFDEYVTRMECQGEWGDHVTLQAAADTFGREIRLFTDQPGAEIMEVSPAAPPPKGGVPRGLRPPLLLTFVTEMHYDAAELRGH